MTEKLLTGRKASTQIFAKLYYTYTQDHLFISLNLKGQNESNFMQAHNESNHLEQQNDVSYILYVCETGVG